MSSPRHVVVAQSGGPTPVINQSLRGVVETCAQYPEVFGTVFAGRHGIEGVLREELLDLSAQPAEEIALLRTTPTAGSIGTCRYKLKPEQTADFDRVIEVLRAHDVGYLFYIGGNDSMDTAHKISRLAAEKGVELVATGVPKTIDNDIGDDAFRLIDHTPGYGSTARYWMNVIQCAEEENRGSCPADPVLVLQAMGRKIGFIPAAARLADPAREMPLQIYLTESGLSIEQLHENVNHALRRHGRCIVVVSEGFDVGEIGQTHDAFGHTQFSASRTTAAQLITNYLNDKGLAVRGSARCQVPGTDQRGAILAASAVDLEEAYRLGQQAVRIAMEDGNGFMSTLLRGPGPVYTVTYDKVPLQAVANSERTFPAAWLTPDRIDVTDDFVRYAKPLVGTDWVSVPMVDGRMRFARLRPLFAEKLLPSYEPQAYRQ